MEKNEYIAKHVAQAKQLKTDLINWKKAPFFQEKEPSALSHMMRKKSYLKKAPPLNTQSFSHILKVDSPNKTIWVEPGVTQEDLAKATLPYGLIPPVIAEFKKITVGGAINGSSLESSSHKYGQFNDPAIRYEILLGNGEIVWASPEENRDLFYGMSGSFGSLGKLLSAELPLIEAKPYVNVHVERFDNFSAFMTQMRSLCKRPSRADYIEGLVFSDKDARIILGSYSDKIEGDFYTQKSFAAEWYHQYVLDHDTFTMPTYDYLFRYDRGAFWMGSYALFASLLGRYFLEGTLFPQSLLTPLKNYPAGKYNEMKVPPYLFRKISGPMMDSASLYKRLHNKRENWFEKHFIVQDFYLPEETAETFIDYAYQNTLIKPIWICPCKGTLTSQSLSPHYGKELFFDVGVYGWPLENKTSQEWTRDLELKCYELEGRKMFYSWNYLTEDELSQFYDLTSYQKLREKYSAECFPDIKSRVLAF